MTFLNQLITWELLECKDVIKLVEIIYLNFERETIFYLTMDSADKQLEDFYIFQPLYVKI